MRTKRIQLVTIGSCERRHDPSHTPKGGNQLIKLRGEIKYPISEIWFGYGKRFFEAFSLLELPAIDMHTNELLGSSSPIVYGSVPYLSNKVWLGKNGEVTLFDEMKLLQHLSDSAPGFLQRVLPHALIITEHFRVPGLIRCPIDLRPAEHIVFHYDSATQTAHG